MRTAVACLLLAIVFYGLVAYWLSQYQIAGKHK
jgi:ABC-type sulfate transport system permease component